eukprot:316693_1
MSTFCKVIDLIDETIEYVRSYEPKNMLDTVSELSPKVSIPSYRTSIFMDGLHFNLLDNEINMNDLSDLQGWFITNEYDTDSLIEDVQDHNESNINNKIKNQKYFDVTKTYICNNLHQHHCCTEDTSKICAITDRVVKLISIYDKYSKKNTTLVNQDIINIINSEIITSSENNYDLRDIVDDYYHIKNYHETNILYMKQLYKIVTKQPIKCNESICNSMKRMDIKNKEYAHDDGLIGWLDVIHYHFVHWIQS